MAPPPEDEGPYAGATDRNTDPAFLNTSQGQPIMGEGVKANLDDLTGYSKNLDTIQGNFGDLARGTIAPLHELILSAFPAGAGNGLCWTEYFLRAAGHNAGQLEVFLGKIQMGIRNVASASQAVANSYSSTDQTSAANMNAIDFAFGDKSKAPPGFPPMFLKEIPTWNQFLEANPGAGFVPQENGVPPGAEVTTSPDGRTTTVTVTLPNGSVMKTVTENWGYYGATGTTRTVYIDGKVQNVNQTTTYRGQTQTTDTQTVYDKNGNRLRDQVTSRTTESVETVDGSTTTTRNTTTYSYDEDGNQVGDPGQSRNSVTVGEERPNVHTDMDDDPGFRRLQELAPEPDEDETILAPGEFGEHGPPPGTTTTTTV
jgi:hypothetical protein